MLNPGIHIPLEHVSMVQSTHKKDQNRKVVILEAPPQTSAFLNQEFYDYMTQGNTAQLQQIYVTITFIRHFFLNRGNIFFLKKIG